VLSDARCASFLSFLLRSMPFIAPSAGDGAAHAASVTFRCPLCGMGAAGTPAGVATAWATSAALAFASLSDSMHGAPAIAAIRRDAHNARDAAIAAAIGSYAPFQEKIAAAAAAAAAAQDPNIAFATAPQQHSPELAGLTDAISAATAAWAAHGGDAAAADGGAAGWLAGLISASAEHASQMHTAAADAPSHGLPDGGAAYVRGAALSTSAMDALEVEAVAVVAESFAAARRFGSDPAIPTVALAALAARLAAAYDVPLRVTQLPTQQPLHIREAIAAARTEDWSGAPRPPHVWAVVLLTLAAVAAVALVSAGGLTLWRRRKAAAAAAGGASGGAAGRKLKRKTSDFFPDSAAAVGGGSLPRGSSGAKAEAAAAGGQLPGVCEVQLGTPGVTPRSPRAGGTPRSARGARGDGAA
jgi:hypothetical protein